MLPELGELAGTALTVVASIIALRLVYLTVVGFAHPALFIEAAKSTSGEAGGAEGMSDLIQGELAALKEEGGGPWLRLLTTTDAAIDVGSIESGGGRLKDLGALLRLLPGRTRTVRLQLLPAGAMGQGIAVTIETSTNRVGATTTLWERRYARAAEFPADIAIDTEKTRAASTEALECLGLAAAAWVAYQTLRASPSADRAGLLTQQWESYALFRVGARMQFLGLATAARRLYLEALTDDPRNRGALFNLGVLDFQEGNEQSAIDRLSVVEEEIRRNPIPDAWRFDRLWYRTEYNIAAAEWNLAFRQGKPSPEVKSRVRRRIRDLVEAADDAIDQLGGADMLQTGSRYADLSRFLVDVRSAAIVIYSDARAPAA
jgi:hypothetical protein